MANIQFHALPEELLSFTKEIVSDFNLHVFAMRFFPFGVIEVAPQKLDDVFLATSPYDRLAFSLVPPALPVKGQLDFYDKNPDRLVLDIQRPSKEGLRQTCLASRSEGFESRATWKEIAKRLKAITKTGVTVVNPDTGVSGRARSFRYTVGAKALEQTGVRMLPVAGGNIIRLGE